MIFKTEYHSENYNFFHIQGEAGTPSQSAEFVADAVKDLAQACMYYLRRRLCKWCCGRKSEWEGDFDSHLYIGSAAPFRIYYKIMLYYSDVLSFIIFKQIS